MSVLVDPAAPVPPGAAAPALARCVADADAAVGALLSRCADEAAPGEVGPAVLSLLRVQARLDAALSTLVARFDRQGGPQLDGLPSTSAWLRARANLSDGEARRLVHLGHAGGRRPEAAAALAEGAIRAEQLRLVDRAIRAASADRSPDDLAARGEALLVEAARGTDTDRLAALAHTWTETVAPEVARHDAEAVSERRMVTCVPTYDGMGSLVGRLTPEAYALWQSVCGPLTAPLPDDARTASQRQHDALVEVLRRGVAPQRVGSARPSGDEGSPAPVAPLAPVEAAQIMVAVDAATFLAVEPPNAAIEGLRAAGLAHAGTGADASRFPLAPDVLARLRCDATVRRLLVDPANAPLALGRRTRMWSFPQRLFIGLRDRHCRWPGCRRPAAWCEIDHIVPWELGGSTDVENGRLLCVFHHQLRHDGWALDTTDPERPTVSPPPDWDERLARRRRHRPSLRQRGSPAA